MKRDSLIREMKMRLFIGIGITMFSSLGWWLGSKMGIYASLLFSTVGGLVGLWIALKLYKRLF